MRPWTVTLEAVLMLMIWVVNALGDIISCFYLVFAHDHGGFVMMSVLGFMHFIINISVIQFQWKSMNKCFLFILFLTQTAPFFMLCRRAWRSYTACCAIDERTKTRKALIAKYSQCCTSWKSKQKLSEDMSAFSQGSCIPSDLIPNYDSISSSIPAQNEVHDDNAVMLEKFLLQDDTKHTPQIPMGTTKFIGNTHDVELNFNTSYELYAGEPKLIKFLMNSLQMLFVDEKKLSYHIVTDSKNTILYASKANKHVRGLPDRLIKGDPPLICCDIHYVLNLAKGYGYEIFAITKRTSDELQYVVEKDISKVLWCLVWPSAVIKLYTLLDIMDHNMNIEPLFFVSPALSIMTWLVTQKGVSEPWINIVILMPLRITMTVTRALLVIGIGLSSIFHGALCYVTAKAAGLASLAIYLAYMKKFRNVELYSDDIVKYTFYTMYQPVIQVCESSTYITWAVWWYSVTPLSDTAKHHGFHLPLIVLMATLIGHVIGVVWLWFARSFLKQPLTNPSSVLKSILIFEYIKT